jgi:Metallo-beta-lactamase superfamily
MELDLPICATCGVQYGSARPDCPICQDQRQYVGWAGQQWTSLAELRRQGHRGRIEDEGPGVTGIGVAPPTAIGQRALLVRTPAGNVLWDMVTYLDDEMLAQVADLGGVDAIALSHPHFYGSVIEWAHAFGAPVYIHHQDRDWVARPDDAIVFWEGGTREILDGVTLVNAGVHFAGGQVLHWAGGQDGAGVLCTGDIFTVVPDRRWLSFMYSYPNLIPERPQIIRRAVEMMQPYSFDRVYGGWWRRNVDTGGAAALRRSADRYLRFALGED